MTRRRWCFALIALSLLAVIVAGFRTVTTPEYSTPGKAEHVVVVGVPALDWEVISPTSMPHLYAAAEQGGIGLTTSRAARSTTCPWDGWVTLGAGNRALYPASIPEDELPPEADIPLPGEPEEPTPTPSTSPSAEEKRQNEATQGCLEQRGSVPTVDGSKLTPAIEENERLNFGAVPGALGSAVQCTTIVGESPVLAVGAKDAEVVVSDRPIDEAGWSDLIAGCPLTLVATGHAMDRSVAQLQALDTAIGQILDGARAVDATVIVAGISQPEYVRSKLHAIVAIGPGFDNQLLSSPSTSRAPFSQLIDIAPTVLSILGEDRPSSMTGQTLRGVDREDSFDASITSMKYDSIGASAHVWMSSKFFTILAWGCLIGSVLLYWRLRKDKPFGRIAQTAAVAIGLLPTASFLLNVVPWWRAGRITFAILAALLGAWIVLTAIATLGPWRRYRSGPALAACGLTFGILGMDVLTGSYLQLNSPLGYDAIVAGRFTGFGNMSFAVFAAAGLVLIAAACRLADSKPMMLAVGGSMGVAMLALDAAPGAGADFGGIIALVPSLILLLLIATRTRISPLRLIFTFAAGAVVVVAVAVADYLRPADSRTHLGRFVGQVLDGTAWTIIERKLSANLRILTGSVLTVLCIALVIIVVLLYIDRSSRAWQYAREREPFVAAGFVAILVMSLLGFAVNDSGIAVTAAALALVVPLVLATVSRRASESDLLL